MPVILPELEYVDRATETIRYLEHGWPSELCRWHSHPEYELHLVLHTHGKAFVGDYIGEFCPGSLFLIGPDLPHNWVTDETTQSGKIAVRDMLVQFGQDSVKRLRCAFREFEELMSMFALARSGIEFTGFDPTLARSCLDAIRDARGVERILALLRFLTHLSGHAEKKTLSTVDIKKPEINIKHSRIIDVVDYIDQNFSETISLNSAAELAGMSAAAFSRNFQRVMGSTFVEFLNRVRIGKACSMLYTTNEQVSVICYEVGFRTLVNFNRQFQKIKNMTPTVYRELAHSELTLKKNAES